LTVRIYVNGAAVEAPDAQTVGGLLVNLGIRGRIAVEVNGELVPRSVHATQALAAEDRIEVVQAIGGGQGTHPLTGAA